MNGKPKGPSIKKVAKSYKKAVKVKTKPVSVQSYQVGSDPKMDRAVRARMGMNVPTGSAYTGPVMAQTRTMKKSLKPMSVTMGVSKPSGGSTKYIKRGKK